MDMVCVCPAGGQMTPGKRGAAISCDECGALVFGDQSVFASHVEWNALGVEHHRNQVRVTGELPDRVDVEGGSAIESGRAESFGEDGLVEDDVEVWLDPAVHW